MELTQNNLQAPTRPKLKNRYGVQRTLTNKKSKLQKNNMAE